MFTPVPSNPDFPALEKQLLDHWYKDGVVDKYLHKNDKAKETFSFLDGPITANNPMGAHHAWGRTYKDLWPRFFNLLGYRQRFQNGFDCQGLWVEVEVEKELGLHTKKDIENLVPYDPTSPNGSVEASKKASIAKFVQLCKDRVLKFSGIQTAQSKRLGYFADWEHSYFTMSDANNYMIWHFLKTCFNNGWIYKGHESVPWCPRCETAISQHEMLTEDYKEVVHESVYMELPIVGRKDEYLLVWTTTPWTIVANIAVAVDEKIKYSLVQGATGFNFWIAKDLIEAVFKKDYKKIVRTVLGKELVGLKYEAPFDHLPAVLKVAKENPKTFHTVIQTDPLIMPISTTEGTGMVHTAVSAGTEDFQLGKKYGLPLIPVIGDDASYLPGMGEFSGKNAKKHPELIIDFLKTHKGGEFLFSTLRYKHRYPACWRCKTELVWKVADEWYIAMDRSSHKATTGEQNLTLRQRMVGVAKSIKWMPEFGLDRELDWLKNMHDWLISKKNRYWGLALPIYECKKCGSFDVVGSRKELQEKAVVGWEKFEGHSPHKPFIDEVKIKCPKCGNNAKRIEAVGNPWLDAGIVPYSTMMENNQGEPLYLKDKSKWKEWFPADFITESFPGQFKNWFYAMIAMSSVLENTLPFKRVLGYGTMVGEDGRPMHKSWGNAVEFNEGADKIGVDVMRWMFARQNPADNMLFGYKKADEVRRQFYLMLWNTYKFFVEYANLDGYTVDFGRNTLKHILDRWIVSRFNHLVLSVEKFMREYDAKNAALEIEKFLSDLSTWFIRRSRDRIWLNSEDENDKQNFYQNLHYILVNLSIILSPFIPFISETIYTNLTDKESVHLSSWPKVDRKNINALLEEEMLLVRKVVEAGHAVRKIKNVKVRIPLARIEIEIESDVSKVSDKAWDVVLKELNAKNIRVNKGVQYPKKEVKVSEEELQKEGELRELIRAIQTKRKELGTQPTDSVSITLPPEFKDKHDYVKKKVLAKEIKTGPALQVTL